jgi:hypothetical protein
MWEAIVIYERQKKNDFPRDLAQQADHPSWLLFDRR